LVRYSEVDKIVFFDGFCNLCSSSVLFIIKRDSKAQFKFFSLQSLDLREIKSKYHVAALPDSLLLIDRNRLFVKSSAALRIAKNLDGVWPLFYGFIIVPAPIRDWMYDLIAKNRYKWFGKRNSCMIPTAELEARFIQ